MTKIGHQSSNAFLEVCYTELPDSSVKGIESWQSKYKTAGSSSCKKICQCISAQWARVDIGWT